MKLVFICLLTFQYCHTISILNVGVIVNNHLKNLRPNWLDCCRYNS